MGAVPIHYVDLRAFSYGTEDERRVERALRTFLPEDAEIERAESEGHHGDRILVLSTRVEHADGIRTVLESILAADGIERVRGELEDRVTEDCELFISFDKQAAYRGSVSLGRGLQLRAKIEAYPAKRETAVENAAAALGG